MKKTLSLSALALILFSCTRPTAQSVAAKAPIDSLIANWGNSWSNHDSAAVSNLFTANALLIDDNFIGTTTNEIATKWIHPNINMVSHFKSTTLQEWSGADRAGYTGKYEFDAIVNDSVVAKPTGVYTVNWIKTDKGDWKITTADIHSISIKK